MSARRTLEGLAPLFVPGAALGIATAPAGCATPSGDSGPSLDEATMALLSAARAASRS